MAVRSLGWLNLLFVLALSACATQHLAPNAPSQLPDTYLVSGRVAVNAKGKGYNAGFAWAHQQNRDAIDINNPLGQTMARLELDGINARFFDGGGQLRAEDDIEALSERELGWRLPALGLRYWVLGLADPARQANWRETTESRTLEQDGWTIEYPREAGGNVPSRLTLSRPDLEVRIALFDWQLGSSSP